jgi:hypothetical protein
MKEEKTQNTLISYQAFLTFSSYHPERFKSALQKAGVRIVD